MYKICVFAGTTEGRELVEFLLEQPVQVTACVATEYGRTLLPENPRMRVSAQRLDGDGMQRLLEQENFTLVVDATHPYAAEVTENIAGACSRTGTRYLRLLRQEGTRPGDCVYVSDPEEAARWLDGHPGNILLTTGSKELQQFAGIRDFADRVYARVLPMEQSLSLCRQAGLQPAHILAMQGPFSVEMNTAMLRAVRASVLVTKASGNPGGFQEKQQAARDAGAVLLVIGRPPQRQGLDFPDMLELLCREYGFRHRPLVTVAGIGPGSRDSVTEQVLRAVREADCLLGAGRMLESFPEKPGVAAIAPGEIAEYIHTHRQYRRFAVLMSGDTGFYSGAKKLLPLLADCRVRVLPGLSSMSVLCARLGVSYEDVLPVSLHGRDRDLCGDVCRNARVFVLVGGENGLGTLCARLTEAGLGHVRVSAGEHLSYPEERITVGTARELSEMHFDSLTAALIENPDPVTVRLPGLPDSAFTRGAGENGPVPMTKSEVRAVCLSQLQPRGDSICWDVGAGTGSVSLELAMHAECVYAIEKNPAALELLRENIRKFGLANVRPVAGTAPDCCRDLPAPTHVFIGGSSGNIRQILALVREKNPHARITATAVTLESVGALSACMGDYARSRAVSLTVARDRRAGSVHLMTGQNPVYLFTMEESV